MVSFIDFYFHFLAISRPKVCLICSLYLPTHGEPGLPVVFLTPVVQIINGTIKSGGIGGVKSKDGKVIQRLIYRYLSIFSFFIKF